VQSVDADAGWYQPLAQLEQAAAPATAMYRPLGQFVQDVAPVDDWYLPAPQLVQPVAPVAPMNVPWIHGKHAADPAVDAKVPAAQLEQLNTVAPDDFKNFPVGQFVQEAEPVDG
jgi:hypothetical protein